MGGVQCPEYYCLHFVIGYIFYNTELECLLQLEQILS